MLLGSNVIIYAARPEHAALREFIESQAPTVSVVSRIEVLGYHKINEADRQFLVRFFNAVKCIPLSERVILAAIDLRRRQRMSLGDSIIAGTAIIYQLTLVTRNTADFHWIEGINLLDPLGNLD